MARQRPPDTPYVYRLIRDADGQSETLGVILLLGITVVGTTGIVAFGSTALNDTENAATSQRTEHTMTLLDSRGAMVALGSSDVQTVDFSGTGIGGFEINPDAGWMKVEHFNRSGNSQTEVIYNRSMGSFTYSDGSATIAYQGGGVWRQADNTTRMVSQPEFHYRGQTLTLPAIRVDGSGGAAGDTSVTLTSPDETERVFPNTTAVDDGTNETGAPYNKTSPTDDQDPYVNPIENGSIFITIHSEYYKGWADFFRSRTTTDVEVHHNNNTVFIELLTPSTVGDFEMPAEENSITVSGMEEEHSVDNFTVTLEASTSNKFRKIHWSLHSEQGGEKLEVHVRNPGSGANADCSEIRDGNSPLSVSIFYTNGSGNQEWQNASMFSDDPNTMIENVDCSGEPRVTMNFTSGATMNYKDIDGVSGSENKWEFGSAIKGDNLQDSLSFDSHDDDTTETYVENDGGPFDAENSTYLINHYFALMAPSFDLTVQGGPGNSNRINEDKSSGTLQYDQSGGRFVTFLHVTENQLNVTVG